MLNHIGVKIKQARKEKGLTQAELAGSTISRSLLSLLENGQSNPSMQTLKYIAEKLDKPISFFLSDMVDYKNACEVIIDEAERLLDDEEYTKAVDVLDKFNENIGEQGLDAIEHNKLGVLNAIRGIAYYHLNNEAAYSNLKEAISMLEDTNDIIYIYKICSCLCHILYKNKDYKEMEYYADKANYAIGYVTNENIYKKLNMIYNLALACFYQNKYEKTISVLNEALMHSRKHEIYYNFGEFSILIALAYRNISEFDKAINANQKAIDYYKLIENDNMMYQTYINISIVFRYTNNYYNSIIYISEAIDYFTNTGNKDILINAKIEKVITLFIFLNDQRIINDSIDEIFSDLEVNDNQRTELLIIKACLAYKNKRYSHALNLYSEAEKTLAICYNSSLNFFVYHGLSKIYEEYGEFDNTLKYLSMLDELVKTKPYYRNSVWENAVKYYFSKTNI